MVGISPPQGKKSGVKLHLYVIWGAFLRKLTFCFT